MQAEYSVAASLLSILSDAAQSQVTVARSHGPNAAYELHPFPDATLRAVQAVGRLLRFAAARPPTTRAVGLYRLLLTCSDNADVNVRYAALRSLRALRSNSR